MNIDDYFEEEDAPQDTPPTDEGQNDPVTTPELDENDDDSYEDEPDDKPIDEIDETAVSYFNFLKEYNVLNTDEDFEFDGSADAIERALNQTKNNTVKQVRDEIWNQLPDDFKPLLEYGLKGGTSLQDYLSTFKEVDYDELDIEDTISQKQLVKDYYKQYSNYSDEKIEKFINNLEKSEALKEAAEEALIDLKEYKETAKANFIANQEAIRLKEQQEIAAATAELEATLSSYTQDTKRVERLKHFIFSPIREANTTTTEFSKVLSNIEKNSTHLIQLADILADYNPNTGFSFERIKKQLKSESAKSFRELLDSKIQKSPIKGNEQRKRVDDELDWDAAFGQ